MSTPYEGYEPSTEPTAEPLGEEELPWELREDGPDVPWELQEGEPDGLITDGTVNWSVIVEYGARAAFGRNQIGVTNRAVVMGDHDTREAALLEARRQAFDFEPPDPLLPRLRQVFETADGYLTLVEGATDTFGFTTRVLKLAGVRDERRG